MLELHSKNKNQKKCDFYHDFRNESEKLVKISELRSENKMHFYRLQKKLLLIKLEERITKKWGLLFHRQPQILLMFQ